MFDQAHVGLGVSGVGGAAFIRTARQGRQWRWRLYRVRDRYDAHSKLVYGDGWRRQCWDLQSHYELLVSKGRYTVTISAVSSCGVETVIA